MGKHYGAEIIAQVLEMKAEGKRNCEIREYFGLSQKQLENLFTRHRIKQENLRKGILPKPNGRPRGENLSGLQKIKLENKRLQTENDLLRSFLQAAERM